MREALTIGTFSQGSRQIVVHGRFQSVQHSQKLDYFSLKPQSEFQVSDEQTNCNN